MRKHLLSLIPMMRQATLHEALTKMYLVAGEKDESSAVTSGNHNEANTRAMKTQLMLISLFAAFDDDFNHGLPLPRSPTTRSIGIDQAVKDAVRERIEVNSSPVQYSVAASDCPEVAAAELTELLGSAISDAKNSSQSSRADLGRLVGRILGALCRTGSGGDTYCAVNALFDIAGTMEKSRGKRQHLCREAAAYKDVTEAAAHRDAACHFVCHASCSTRHFSKSSLRSSLDSLFARRRSWLRR